MATTGDGFKVTIGVFLAILFVVVGIPILMCGGCATFFVGSGVAVTGTAAYKQAQEATERAKQKREQPQVEQAAQPDVPRQVAEPVAKPEVPEQPAAAAEEMPAKPEVQAEAKPQEADQAAEQEKTAAAKLKLAKGLIGKSRDAANKRLKEIIEKFPGTEAAKEAQQLLDK